MTDDEIAEIESRLQNATPGPWEWLNRDEHLPQGLFHKRLIRSQSAMYVQYPGLGRKVIEDGNWYVPPADADLDLIANAPTDIAVLLAEIRELRAEKDAARYSYRGRLDRDNYVMERKLDGQGIWEPVPASSPSPDA